MKGGMFMTTLELVIGFLFVILFSVILELVIKSPFIVAAVIAVASLVIYGIFSSTLTTTFIIWIVVYTLTALIVAFITDYVSRNRRNNSCF